MEKSLGELIPIGRRLVEDIPQKRRKTFPNHPTQIGNDPFAIRPSIHDMILNPISGPMKCSNTNKCPSATSTPADASLRSHPPVPRAIEGIRKY